MRHRQPNGVEISGFIDFEESLRKCIFTFEEAQTDWYAVFNHSKRIRPTKKDLGFVYTNKFIIRKITIFDRFYSYFNWGNGISCLNDTKNFKAIADPILGLIFESRSDRTQILMDPLAKCSRGTTRTEVTSSNYDNVVLFDHVVRNKI